VRRFDENHRVLPASMFIVACGGHDQTVSAAVDDLKLNLKNNNQLPVHTNFSSQVLFDR